MSLNKPITGRLNLMAGASLVAASLTTFAGLMPTTASAQVNACGNPTANGGAADTVICAPGTYATGIDYSTTTDGDLTVVLSDRVNTGTSNSAGTGPIRMYGDTGEDMTLIRQDNPGVIGDPRIVNSAGDGRAIDVSTQGDGNISINLTDGDPAAGEPVTPLLSAPSPMRIRGSTEAIRAQAFGSGNVSIVIGYTGAPSGIDHRVGLITTTAGGTAMNAISSTGDINIDTHGAELSGGAYGLQATSASGNITISTGVATGSLYGIRAQTGGAGTIDVTLHAGASGSTNAGIGLVSDTGEINLVIEGGNASGGFSATSAPAIQAASAATSATAAVNVQNTGGVVHGRVDFAGVSAGGVTFANQGAGAWTTFGASVFSNQGDTVLLAGAASHSAAAGTTVDFAGGADLFDMQGQFSVTGLTLNNLEVFDHSGVLYMGSTAGVSDGETDDILRMTSGTWKGSGGRVVMDVLLTAGTTQAGCATPVVSDCLDLRGAATEGVTYIRLNDLNPNTAATVGFVPLSITIVDVGGGTSAAEHIQLDPESPGYVVDYTFGGMVQRTGLFGYALRYDPDTQQHVLIGMPRSEALEYLAVTGAAHSIWHLTAETVNERQADLREGAEGGAVWVRASGEKTERDLDSTFQSVGETFTLNSDYDLFTGTVIGGWDMVTGGGPGGAYVLGLQLGYVQSRLDFDISPSSAVFTGATGGAYASYWTDRFFLDGAVNLNGLSLDYDQPGVTLKTNTFLNSVGARVDTGLRANIADGLFVEPLATLAYVRTTFEDISITGGDVDFRNAESLRGALGLRVGGTLSRSDTSLTYFVAGRSWNEFEGDSGGVVNNPGVDLPFVDDFSGSFSDVELGLNVSNTANTLSGLLTSGMKWKDDYQAINVSLGVRWAW